MAAPSTGSSCAQFLDLDGRFTEASVQSAMSNLSNYYYVVSVFGAQGSGKSTLMNSLFSTRFMAPVQHPGRVTEGAWVQSASQGDLNVIVLDIEGTGGIDRAAKPDLERQLGMFALTAADAVVLNINNVLVENADTINLLHVVLQEKLRLEAQQSNASHFRRTVLFIVVRDIAPTEQQGDDARANIFKRHLENVWRQLVKPPGLQASKFEDYFQVETVGLQDKRYREENFMEGARGLADRIKQAGRSSPAPLRSQIPTNLYAHYVKELWSQITSAQGLRLQNVFTSLGEAACSDAAVAALVKFGKQSKWLSIKQSCQERLLPLREISELVMQATDQTLEGYEASVEWCDRTAAATHKDALKNKILDLVFVAVTVPQVAKMEKFRLAYFVEHILPSDPESPTCSDRPSGQSAFGGAATLRAYKTGDVNYIDLDDSQMTKAEISCTCELYGAYIIAMHKLAGKTLEASELQKTLKTLHGQLVQVVEKVRKAQAVKAKEAQLRQQAKAQAEKAAAETERAKAALKRAQAAEAQRAEAEARLKAAEAAQARAAQEMEYEDDKDDSPSYASMFMGALVDALPDLIGAFTSSSSSSPSSSSYGRQIFVGPRGGRYYINKNGNKVYVS